MSESGTVEQSPQAEIWGNGWNEPFRTIGTPEILEGTSLDFKHDNATITLETEATPTHVLNIKRKGPTESAIVAFKVKVDSEEAKTYHALIQTLGSRTFKGEPSVPGDGTVRFREWRELLLPDKPGVRSKYSKTARTLTLTALELQNSTIMVNKEQPR